MSLNPGTEYSQRKHVASEVLQKTGNKEENLANRQRNINDKELYEAAEGKKNSVNERSFVYINRRYKTSVLSALPNWQYKYPLMNRLSHSKVKSFQLHELPKKIYTTYVDPPVNIVNRLSKNTLQYVPVPKLDQPSQQPKGIKKDMKEILVKSQNQTNVTTDNPKEYRELLKLPVERLKEYFRANVKVNKALKVTNTSKIKGDVRHLRNETSPPPKRTMVTQFAPSPENRFGMSNNHTVKSNIYPNVQPLYRPVKTMKIGRRNFMEDDVVPTKFPNFLDKLVDEYTLLDNYLKSVMEKGQIG